MGSGLGDCKDSNVLDASEKYPLSMTAIEETWAPGIQQLINDARSDVDDLLKGRVVRRAEALSVVTGSDFAEHSFPMYFTGDFESTFVMVHLNPKLSDRLSKVTYTDFDAYLEAHRRFGYHHWELDPSYRSAFDHKQVRFLRPFGVIDFVPDTVTGHDRVNAARAIDHKLQLELIPYATPTFSDHDFNSETLAPHFERVLAAIAAYPRDYVIFCGAVFDRLLSRSDFVVAREDHRFHLPTTKGTSVSEYRFSNVTFRYGDKTIHADVAQSFATQGIPMPAYGAMCHDLYDTKGVNQSVRGTFT